jgi:hypothetical protein
MGTIELDPRLCHATTFLGRSPKMLIDAQIVGAVAISFEWLAPEADWGERRPAARRVPGGFQPQARHRQRARRRQRESAGFDRQCRRLFGMKSQVYPEYVAR